MLSPSTPDSTAFHNCLANRLEYSSHASWRKIQEASWNQFLLLGLPTKKTEVYRYIKLRELYSKQLEEPNTPLIDSKAVDPHLFPECQQQVLVFVNGRFSRELSRTNQLPTSLEISSLKEASSNFRTFFGNYWSKSLKEESDPFAALNGACNQEGLFLYIPPKLVIESPIQILHLNDTDKPNCFLNPRLTIFAGSQSQATFVSIQKNISSFPQIVNFVVDVVLEDQSKIDYTQVLCDAHSDSWIFEALRGSLKKNASLKAVCVSTGAATVRTDYKTNLTGENGEAMLNSVWLLKEKNEYHANVLIDHQAPYCRSFQLFKGVLKESSRSSFEGKIMVRRPAQKTEAFQLNNNLILDDHAHADSKPNLEIFADDVKASHGATVGQLDQEQLFYLTTRGINEETAKQLLVYGFCESVIEKIPLESLKQHLSQSIKSVVVEKEK